MNKQRARNTHIHTSPLSSLFSEKIFQTFNTLTIRDHIIRDLKRRDTLFTVSRHPRCLVLFCLCSFYVIFTSYYVFYKNIFPTPFPSILCFLYEHFSYFVLLCVMFASLLCCFYKNTSRTPRLLSRSLILFFSYYVIFRTFFIRTF